LPGSPLLPGALACEAEVVVVVVVVLVVEVVAVLEVRVVQAPSVSP
jgi:hypothetical protein